MKNKSGIYYTGAALLLVLGVALFAVDLLKGEAKAGLVLIIPFIVGGGLYSFLGILSLIGAFFLFYIGLEESGRFADIELEEERGTVETEKPGKVGTAHTPPTKSTRKYGGVILIGPFPVIFGSDKKMAIIAVALAIILLVISFIALVFILRI